MFQPAERRIISKPWGKRDPGALAGMAGSEKVGEIWLDAIGSDILVKFLFTSERLSIQVHPNDAQARAMGRRRGKEECWLVLEAQPGACYAAGLKRSATKEELREAAVTGAIVDLVDWRPANVGDFIYIPAGTIHTLGPGLTVLEVQQNSDVTLRLFDYFSKRELHIDAAVEVARRGPHSHASDKHINFRQTTVLVDGPLFGVAYCSGSLPPLQANATDIQLVSWTSPVMIDARITIPPGCSVSLSEEDASRLPGGQEFFLAWSSGTEN